MTTRIYRGIIAERDDGEAMDVLFLEDSGDPLAGRVADDMDEHGRYLTVRYWTASAPADDDVIREAAVREMLGEGDARFTAHYSEVTGYLWTDEDLMVGGHDLLEELRSHVGEYCLLEIGYSEGPAGSAP